MKKKLTNQTIGIFMALILGQGSAHALVQNLIERGRIGLCPGDDEPVELEGTVCAIAITTMPPYTILGDSNTDYETEESQARLAAEATGVAEPFLLNNLSLELNVQPVVLKECIMNLSQQSQPLTKSNILLELKQRFTPNRR